MTFVRSKQKKTWKKNLPKFNSEVRVLIHLKKKNTKNENKKKLQNKVETFASLAKIAKLVAKRKRKKKKKRKKENRSVFSALPKT